MSSKASSEQSCLHEGVGYDEVYASGQDDLGTSYSERVPSANSPSKEEEEDSDVDSSKSTSRDSDDEENIENAEFLIRSIIGLDSFRKFILPLMSMVNDSNSTIKRPHFDTFWERYQIPVGIPIRVPFKFEKYYYRDVEDVGVYEQMFKARLRLPLSALYHRLLQYLGLAVTQITLNAWRIFLGVEVLYGVLTNGEHQLTMEKFFHCYLGS